MTLDGQIFVLVSNITEPWVLEWYRTGTQWKEDGGGKKRKRAVLWIRPEPAFLAGAGASEKAPAPVPARAPQSSDKI